MNRGPSTCAAMRPGVVYHRMLAACLAGFAAVCAPCLVASEPLSEISFRRDVMAVLSKAGCNSGVCHGNKQGKGGFKLSLRGENPGADFTALTRDLSGRRVNAFDPDRSLFLLKPSMQVAHEGGRRFGRDSLEFAILRDWISTGMPSDPEALPRLAQLSVEPAAAVLAAPADEVALRVTATFADGQARDVTRLATYELSNQTVAVDPDGLVHALGLGEATVIVRYLERQVPARLAFVRSLDSFAWTGPFPANFIDEHVFAKLKSQGINPSPACDDSVFVRRAYLDLLGLLPTAEEARAFVADGSPGKRARLIDTLLDRPEFADCWALKWSDLLRNEEKALDRKGVQNFHFWIRRRFAENVPLDVFVRDLIASRGSTYTAPAANYWRAMREPLVRAESTAQVFLGVRLQCAKCHNHPFEHWTQNDYYSWSNVFARVGYNVIENHRPDENDKNQFDGEQIVYMSRAGDVPDPRTGRPAAPRFLGSDHSALADDADRLLALADWIVHPENRLFVNAQANRLWFQLLGRGIVDPIDDVRSTNPPSNPALLDALARELVECRFDVRHMIRTIMNSHTYQASTAANDTNREDEANFSHALEQRLPAEVLLDALCGMTEVQASFSGYPPDLRAGRLPGVRTENERDRLRTAADQFLALFGKPQRLQSCECERAGDANLSQTFQLVSGELVNDLLSRRDNRIGRLLEAGRSNAEILDELYWSALSRAPSTTERDAALGYLPAEGSERRAKLEDVLWGLLNSNEFLLRR